MKPSPLILSESPVTEEPGVSVDAVLARLDFRNGEWVWSPVPRREMALSDAAKDNTKNLAYEFVEQAWRPICDPARLAYLGEISRRIQMGQ